MHFLNFVDRILQCLGIKVYAVTPNNILKGKWKKEI